MGHNKKMTIVVPVRNREQLVVRCLDSLSAQTWRPLHVIVVDNASTDNTRQVVEKWFAEHSTSDFETSLEIEPCPGACKARQRGLDIVTTPYVMFFDSDDVMRPRTVEYAMKAFKANAHADLIAWPVEIHFCDGKTRLTKSIGKGVKQIMERHLIHSVLRTQGYAVKTEFLRRVGGWKGSLPAWNDWELGVRLLALNPNIVALKTPGADVFHQKESITGERFSDKAGVWEQSLMAVARDLTECKETSMRGFLPLVAYRCAVLAAHYKKEGDPRTGERLMKNLLYVMKKNRATARTLFGVSAAYRITAAGHRGAYLLLRSLF